MLEMIELKINLTRLLLQSVCVFVVWWRQRFLSTLIKMTLSLESFYYGDFVYLDLSL